MMAEPFKMDIEAIMRQLPHRYPFLLVDRVLAVGGVRSDIERVDCYLGALTHRLGLTTYSALPGCTALA